MQWCLLQFSFPLASFSGGQGLSLSHIAWSFRIHLGPVRLSEFDLLFEFLTCCLHCFHSFPSDCRLPSRTSLYPTSFLGKSKSYCCSCCCQEFNWWNLRTSKTLVDKRRKKTLKGHCLEAAREENDAKDQFQRARAERVSRSSIFKK